MLNEAKGVIHIPDKERRVVEKQNGIQKREFKFPTIAQLQEWASDNRELASEGGKVSSIEEVDIGFPYRYSGRWRNAMVREIEFNPYENGKPAFIMVNGSRGDPGEIVRLKKVFVKARLSLGNPLGKDYFGVRYSTDGEGNWYRQNGNSWTDERGVVQWQWRGENYRVNDDANKEHVVDVVRRRESR